MVWCLSSGAVDVTEMTGRKHSYQICVWDLKDSPDLANPCESDSKILSLILLSHRSAAHGNLCSKVFIQRASCVGGQACYRRNERLVMRAYSLDMPSACTFLCSIWLYLLAGLGLLPAWHGNVAGWDLTGGVWKRRPLHQHPMLQLHFHV